MNAVKMRSTLSSRGAQLGHFATTFGAVMMRTSLSVFVVEGDLHLGAATLRFDGRVKKRSAAPQQTAVSQVLSTRGKCLGGPAPLELLHIPKQRRVRPECRQTLEQQRQIALLPEDGGREVLDDAVLVQEPCRGDRTDPRNPWISVCRVADEGEEVRDQGGIHPELLAHARRIADLLPLAIRSEEHTSELQSPCNLVCRLLLEKKK